MCNTLLTPHSSLDKDNSLNHFCVSPRMGCLEYTELRTNQLGMQFTQEESPRNTHVTYLPIANRKRRNNSQNGQRLNSWVKLLTMPLFYLTIKMNVVLEHYTKHGREVKHLDYTSLQIKLQPIKQRHVILYLICFYSLFVFHIFFKQNGNKRRLK